MSGWRLLGWLGRAALVPLDFACWLERRAAQRRWERGRALNRAERRARIEARAAAFRDPTLELQLKLPREPRD